MMVYMAVSNICLHFFYIMVFIFILLIIFFYFYHHCKYILFKDDEDRLHYANVRIYRFNKYYNLYFFHLKIITRKDNFNVYVIN